MFSYRYFILLPPGHFYKKRPVYRSFLVVVVIGSAVIPPPLIAWSCYSSDSNTVKDNLVKVKHLSSHKATFPAVWLYFEGLV